MVVAQKRVIREKRLTIRELKRLVGGDPEKLSTLLRNSNISPLEEQTIRMALGIETNEDHRLARKEGSGLDQKEGAGAYEQAIVQLFEERPELQRRDPKKLN